MTDIFRKDLGQLFTSKYRTIRLFTIFIPQIYDKILDFHFFFLCRVWNWPVFLTCPGYLGIQIIYTQKFMIMFFFKYTYKCFLKESYIFWEIISTRYLLVFTMTIKIDETNGNSKNSTNLTPSVVHQTFSSGNRFGSSTIKSFLNRSNSDKK